MPFTNTLTFLSCSLCDDVWLYCCFTPFLTVPRYIRETVFLSLINSLLTRALSLSLSLSLYCRYISVLFCIVRKFCIFSYEVVLSLSVCVCCYCILMLTFLCKKYECFYLCFYYFVLYLL